MEKHTLILGFFILAAFLTFTASCDVVDGNLVSRRFKITCENHASSGFFNGMPATGKTATWEMTEENVGYWSYRIEFLGYTEILPDNVDVTLTWTKDNSNNFWWGNSTNSSDTVTISVPKTGGTIGLNGTVLDSGGNARPTVQGTNPDETAGTITFKATSVETLTITVLRP